MHTLNTIVTLNCSENGDTYMSAKIEESVVATWLNSLEKAINHTDFLSFTANQQRRDNRTHHLTVINPLEYPSVGNDAKKFISYQVHVNIFGIGTIKENDNEVYFLVCESEEINKIRESLNLVKTDLHITLGFKEHDVFDRLKNKTTLISPYSIIEGREAPAR